MNDLTRRNIRYICFRLQTEAEGGNKATVEETGIMSHVEQVKKHMEAQEGFGGWTKFAKTWDVDEKAKLVVVNRTSSIQSEWNRILRKQAKNLPVAAKRDSSPPSTPPRGPGGKFVSKSKPTKTPEEDKKSFWKRLV